MKALQPEVLKNELGKFIPFIFIEWIHLKNAPNCPQYEDWVKIFFEGGYYPANPGSWFYVWAVNILFLLFQTTIAGNKEKTDMNTVETKRWVDLLWIHNSVNMNVQM